MRHPLWILNSILVLLLIGIAAFIFFSQQEVPEAESIAPTLRAGAIKKETSKININKIYEDDLFDTYQKEVLKPKEPMLVVPMPEAPQQTPVRIPESPKPQFFEPLQITLKGIMATSDDANNVAIILDNKTKREVPYKVGEKIEDAQLIRIFKNKVIFLRSNGQQEAFYLRQQDAQQDPTFAKVGDWKDVVKKVAPNTYEISSSAFTIKIPNLAQFIDLLDLTTVYQQGQSVGVRVGGIDTENFATALGLKAGDVIVNIADISAADTQDRIEIYNRITAMHEGDKFNVTLQRNDQIFILTYILHEFAEIKKAETPVASGGVSEYPLQEEQRKILEKKHSFAPTLQEIRQQERKTMLQKGGPAPSSENQNKTLEQNL